MIRLLTLSATLITGVLIATALSLPLMPLSTDSLLFALAFGQIPLLVIALGILSWTMAQHRQVMERHNEATGALSPGEMARQARWMAMRRGSNRDGQG